MFFTLIEAAVGASRQQAAPQSPLVRNPPVGGPRSTSGLAQIRGHLTRARHCRPTVIMPAWQPRRQDRKVGGRFGGIGSIGMACSTPHAKSEIASMKAQPKKPSLLPHL